ncbi:MAG: 50S ribosomal protein L25/general stress protein Ctc [Gammaproteobacteria bacterium]|nr:50S ribosomal protein L25/general stress protein Ctc [Gammaproteobacteria bacterium]
MSDIIEIKAQARTDVGKGASRRLRRAGMVPGIVYGAHKDPEMVMIVHHKLAQQLEYESTFSTILSLDMGGRKQQVLLKDLQRHPYKPYIEHIDFQRISATEKIRTNVPIHLVGEEASVGVKVGGGTVSHHIPDVEVTCLPKDLPEYLELDVSAMDVGDAIKLSQVPLPEGVEIPILSQGEEYDLPVVSVQILQMAEDVVEEIEGEEAEEGDAVEEKKPADED